MLRHTLSLCHTAPLTLLPPPSPLIRAHPESKNLGCGVNLVANRIFNYPPSLSLNSGSAALELAYRLIDIQKNDEVIVEFDYMRKIDLEKFIYQKGTNLPSNVSILKDSKFRAVSTLIKHFLRANINDYFRFQFYAFLFVGNSRVRCRQNIL